MATIDTLFLAFRDLDGLTAYAAPPRRMASSMLAIHPTQVEVINAAFTPGADEITHARHIVGRRAAARRAMVDAAHFKQVADARGGRLDA